MNRSVSGKIVWSGLLIAALFVFSGNSAAQDAPLLIKGSYSSKSGAAAASSRAEVFTPVAHVTSASQSSSDEAVRQANAKMALQDYKGAVQYSSRAITLNPRNVAAYLIMGAAHNYLAAYDDAIADATSAISIDPGNATAFNVRAWAYLQKEQIPKSYDDASRAIEFNPALASAYYNRSLSAKKLENARQELDDLHNAAVLDPAYKTRYQEALKSSGKNAAGFEYQGSAFPEDVKAAAPQESSAEEERDWTKVYLTLAGFIVGVFILIQVVNIITSRKKTSAPANLLFNQYLVVRQIGEGGMGVVYEGVDKTLNRRVAIKKVRQEMGMSQQAREQLLTEARTVASLHHPNIVDIYTVFQEKGDTFLVFEYVQGQTLENRLDLDGKLSLAEAKPIFHAICKALEYAHANGITHRDLKPANIMLADDGAVKVMDFGVAKQFRTEGEQKTVSGTPAYMAPEQAKGIVRKESDVYSMGICLYEALVGHVPWDMEGFDPAKGAIVPASKTVSGMPTDVDRLIDDATAETLEKRIPTPSAFWDRLSAIKS